MTRLNFQEVPNLEDDQLKRFIQQIDQLRSSLVQQSLEILRQTPPKARTSPAVSALGLLQRLAECSVSVAILAAKGQRRDCAVLLVTIMELRLDLQYISVDSQRADYWLGHTQLHRKPWAVAKQLKELFPVPEELEAEQSNYQRLSMAKHGNPAGGLESFPIGLSRWAIGLPGKAGGVTHLCALLYCLGMNLWQAMDAGFRLLRREGFQVDGVETRAKAQLLRLENLMKEHIIDYISRPKEDG